MEDNQTQPHTVRSFEGQVAGFTIVVNQSYSTINRDSVITVHLVRDQATIICSHATTRPMTMKDQAFDSARAEASNTAGAMAVIVRRKVEETRRTIAVAMVLHNEGRSEMHPADPALLTGLA